MNDDWITKLKQHVKGGFSDSDAPRGDGWYVQTWVSNDSLSIDVDVLGRHLWVVVS